MRIRGSNDLEKASRRVSRATGYITNLVRELESRVNETQELRGGLVQERQAAEEVVTSYTRLIDETDNSRKLMVNLLSAIQNP